VRASTIIWPVVAGVLAGASGAAGARLVPDSELYASGSAGLRAVAVSLSSRVLPFGMGALIVASAIAAGAAVALVAPESRWWFTLATAWWFSFPGLDALGAVCVLLLLRTDAKLARALLLVVTAAVHPVAAIVAFPFVYARDVRALAQSFVLALAVIVTVGELDVYSTTARYLLPFVCACAVYPLFRGEVVFPRRAALSTGDEGEGVA
jgi:hypothetical protein